MARIKPQLDKRQLQKTLNRFDILVRDQHFVYNSGDHGDDYFNKDELSMRGSLIGYICAWLAAKLTKKKIDVVLAPAVGAISMANWLAYYLELYTKKPVLAVYAEKKRGRFVLTRGFDKRIAGKRVLVVDDVLRTGGSCAKIIRLARRHKADVIGASALCHRGNVTTEMLGNIPFLLSFLELSLPDYPAKSCPLCRKGVPINTELGHGAAFVAKHGQPPYHAF